MKGIFRWLVNDLRTDWLALKEAGRRIREGEPLFQGRQKEMFNGFSWGRFLDENKYFFLVFGMGIVVGWIFSANHYAGVAQDVIYDLCVGPVERGELVCRPVTPDVGGSVFNVSLEAVKQGEASIPPNSKEIGYP